MEVGLLKAEPPKKETEEVMKMIVKALEERHADNILRLALPDFPLPGIWLWRGVWVNNQDQKPVFTKVWDKDMFARPPLPNIKDVNSFQVFKTSAPGGGPGLALISGARGIIHKSLFLIFDFQERWKTEEPCHFLSRNFILGAIWHCQKRLEVEVEQSELMRKVLRVGGDADLGTWVYPAYKNTFLRPIDCEWWLRRAGKEAFAFVRAQRQLLPGFTDASDVPDSYELCLPMWERTMLGGFLKRLGLS